MDYWLRPGTESLVGNARMMKGDCATLSADIAINGTVSVQMLVREVADFDLNKVTVENLPEFAEGKAMRVEYCLFNDGVPYPDMVTNNFPYHLKAFETAIVFVEIKANSGVKPGNYPVDIRCNTSALEFTCRLDLNVRNVEIPAPKDAALNHEYFLTCNGLDRFPNIKFKSDEWLELMAKYAKGLKELRVNSFFVDTSTLLYNADSHRMPDGSYKFDFSLFDRYIECFLKNGSFRRISLAGMTTNLTGEKIGTCDENGKWILLDTMSPEGEKYLSELFTAIYNHFEEKGWLSMLYIHLEDEPHETEHWSHTRSIAAKSAPGIKCSDAQDMLSSAKGLAASADEFIPRLEVFEEDINFFKQLQSEGKGLWCYSCCYPLEMWYQNKFIDIPVNYCKLVYWTCKYYGITGFLHWGFNFWDAELYGLSPNARFKGDGYIVYPDTENCDVIPSRRYYASVEGAEEYELMILAEKKHPEEVKKLVESMTWGFGDFNRDPMDLWNARSKLFALVCD